MRLHEDKELYSAAIIATSQELSIPDQYIEKDYWVTTVLKQLSRSENIIDSVVFKGGTSLSKVYRVIDRFSEDIDFGIIIPEGLGSNPKRRILKDIEETLGKPLTLIPDHARENKQSDIRKTIYSYPDIVDGAATFVKREIDLELSMLSRPHPFAKRHTESYIGEFLKSNKPELIDQYEMQGFEINVLDLHRTYFEKILALVRHSHYERQRILNRVRHFYDVHLITSSQGLPSLMTEDNMSVIEEIRADDKNHSTFKNDTEYHEAKLCDSPLFIDWDPLWSDVKQRFKSELTELCWSDSVPSDEEVQMTFNEIGSHFQKLSI